MSNLLIVEGKSDQPFIEALTKHLNLSNIEFGIPVCKIDDYECLQGEGELGKQLKSLINEIKNGRKEIRKSCRLWIAKAIHFKHIARCNEQNILIRLLS